MIQHCHRDMTNTPSRPMNSFGCPKLPRAVSNPPPPAPGRLDTSPRNVRFQFPGMFLGTLRKPAFMPCKKSGSMKNSWELFLSAVWKHVNRILFPGTLCNVPRNLFTKIPKNGSLDFFLMCPVGGIQAGMWMGLVSREDSSLKS